eukprot:gene28220-37133_t
MSSAADIVKRLQSLQKCLSELQSQNKILKDLNHSLAAEKSELLEKIAVLEASQSKTSTEAKADTKSSDIVESVLPQKVEPDAQKNKKKSNLLLAQGIAIPKKPKSEESQQPVLKPLANQMLGGPSKIFSIPFLQWAVSVSASEPLATGAIHAADSVSKSKPSPTVAMKKQPPATKERIEKKASLKAALLSSLSAATATATGLELSIALSKVNPAPVAQPIRSTEIGWKHYTPTARESTKSTESNAVDTKNTKASSKIDNSGGKEQVSAVLMALTPQNFHSVAYHISKADFKPSVVARVIQKRINQLCSSSIKIDNITSLKSVQGEERQQGTTPELLPASLVADIDLLVSCCNSILTRTNSSGISFIKQLLDHFQVLALAGIHAISDTPVYTIATGYVTERQLPRPAAGDSTKQDVAHIWSMDGDDDEVVDGEEEEKEQEEEGEEEKMEKYDLDNDLLEDSREGKNGKRTEDDSRSDGDDDDDASTSSSSSSTSSSISATEFLALLVDRPGLSSEQETEQPKEIRDIVIDPRRTYQLQLAGHIYFLLSFYTRSGWTSTAIHAIRAMALITTHLPAVGVLLGVGHVMVLYRHQMLTKHSDLSEILTQWADELACVGQILQQGFSDMEVRSLKTLLGKVFHVFSEYDTTTATATATAMVPLPISDGDRTPDRSILLTALTYRRQGLWKAVEEAPFDVIGLSRVKILAQRSQVLLNLSRRSIENTSSSDIPTSESRDSFSSIFSSLSTIAVANATTEEDIITHYASHWKSTWTEYKSFSWDDLQVALRSISSLLYAFLHAEYAMGGWTIESGYDALTLFSKLKRRTVQFNNATSASPKIKMLFPAMMSSLSTSFYGNRMSGEVMLTHYSSIESDDIKSAVLLLDKWIHVIHEEGNLLSMSASDSVPLELQPKVDKLAMEALEMGATLTYAVLEIIIFLTACSLRGMLRAIVESSQERKEAFSIVDRNSSHSGARILIDERQQGLLVGSLIDLLCQLPSPWGPHARADIQYEMLLANKHQYFHQVSIPRRFPLSERETRFCRWRLGLQSRMPVFVINLDRRRDRWRRVTMMAERSGLSAIRVSAVDGARLAEDRPAQGDSYTLSEKDVATHWNSTFNATFDRKCHPDLNTPMTLSERACAASHLKIWRMIQDIHQSSKKKPTNKRKSPGQDRNEEGGVADSWSVDMYKHVWTTRRRDYYLVFEDDASILSTCAFDFRQELDIILTHIPELHAYVVTSRAAEKLIENLPISAPVDNYVATLIYDGVLTAYAVERRMVAQHGGGYQNRSVDSDIRHSGRF